MDGHKIVLHQVVQLVQSYGLKAWQAGYPGSPLDLFNTLQTGWKIIAFVRPITGPIGHYIVLEGIDNNGFIIVSDPYTGLTFPNTLNDLYYRWHWGDSIVVGR